MTETAYKVFEQCIKDLKLHMEVEEFAAFVDNSNLSEESVNSIGKLLDYIREKKRLKAVEILKKLSRLPLKSPKTFNNYQFEDVRGKDIEKLRSIPNMAAIYENKNLAFIGKRGVGKTHLAMAFGLECCNLGLKTYFTTFSELNEKFTEARHLGTTGKVLSNLTKPSCLIIDEIDYCTYDLENTRLFFHLINRRYSKEGPNNMVFTSNKDPALWKDLFSEDDTLQCALDRIFDNASVFIMKGETHRGRNREIIALTSVLTKDSGESEK